MYWYIIQSNVVQFSTQYQYYVFKCIQTVFDIKVLGSQLWSSVIKQHLSIERDHHGAFSHVHQATHHIASLPWTSQGLDALMVPLSLNATGRRRGVRQKKKKCEASHKNREWRKEPTQLTRSSDSLLIVYVLYLVASITMLFCVWLHPLFICVTHLNYSFAMIVNSCVVG